MKGSGVVVIGPFELPVFHGMSFGQLGGGVVGMFFRMQSIVRQPCSGESQFGELGRKLCLGARRRHNRQGTHAE